MNAVAATLPPTDDPIAAREHPGRLVGRRESPNHRARAAERVGR